jgi:hypothetical protein
MLRRKANKPVKDDPLSNTDNAVLSFIQGRELCSHGIISVSHCARTRWKNDAMAVFRLTVESINRHAATGAIKVPGLYKGGRSRKARPSPASSASAVLLYYPKTGWPLAVANSTSKQSTATHHLIVNHLLQHLTAIT